MAASASVLDVNCEEKMLSKMSAIRDYPPGIGQTRIFLGERVSAIRDYPPFCGPNSASLFSKVELIGGHLGGGNEERKRKFDSLVQLGGCETKMTARKSVNHSSMILVKKEEGNASDDDGMNGKSSDVHGERRVSAIRDCPPFCGPNSAMLFSKVELIEGHFRGGNEERKRKFDSLVQLDRCETKLTARKSVNHSSMIRVKKEEGNASDDDGMNGKSSDVRGSFCDNLNPRDAVRDTLRLFHDVCKKLMQGGKARIHRRVDLEAAKILKREGKFVNEGDKIVGSVPGVEVGDEFEYRVELNIVGIHRQTQAGIDYAKVNGEHIATSIVASGGYSDKISKSGILIYSGHGGNVMSRKKDYEDQKLVRGNLALRNSIKKKNPVRVIRGALIGDVINRRFMYDGLYVVEKYWQERGAHGKLIFKFQLRKIPNQ